MEIDRTPEYVANVKLAELFREDHALEASADVRLDGKLPDVVIVRDSDCFVIECKYSSGSKSQQEAQIQSS